MESGVRWCIVTVGDCDYEPNGEIKQISWYDNQTSRVGENLFADPKYDN